MASMTTLAWPPPPSTRQEGLSAGVIAGNRTIDPITSAVLDGPNDGRVAVDDTKVEGMKDFVVVEHSHAFMMRMRRTIDLTLAFLANGTFGE